MIEQIFAVLMSFLMSILSFFGIILPTYDVKPIQYGSSAMQTMDIYVPNNASEKNFNSAVLFLHGGMFKSGDKSEMKNDCQRLAERGYITATMDYSLIGEKSKVSINTMLDDINNAIYALDNFSYENNLNITKLALVGTSAGGCLALRYAYESMETSPIKIKFVAAKAAPADFDYSIWEANYSRATFADLVSKLSTIEITADTLDSERAKEACELISPVHYIRENTKLPPTLLAYAVNDNVVPFGNKTSIETKLKDNKVKFNIVEYSNLKFDPLKDADYSKLLLDYCKNYL